MSVSIIMPAFNVEKFVSDAINSVLNQTYKNFELIIIDDGSKDNTLKVVCSFDDKRIKVLKQENLGVSKARNAGINKSQNKYIAFIDSDDKWHPKKLENFINNISENNIGIYHSNVILFDENGKDLSKYNYSEPISLDNDRDLILIYDFIVLSSVIIPKKVLTEFNGFAEDLNGTEDWDLWIKITRRYNIYKIEEYDTFYRVNPNGLSKNRKLFLLEEYKVIQRHLLLKNVDNYIKNKALWVWYRKNFYYWLKAYNPTKSIIFFLKMLYSDPFNNSNFNFLIKIVKKLLLRIKYLKKL
jgi:glycosyltransferase involved in cell wall biosynthesis